MARYALLFVMLIVMCRASPAADPLAWPAESAETRPWSYWWWMASAVDTGNITRELETFQRAGWGGVHIIPIYGAKGFENRTIEYLSPKWMSMLDHSVVEGRRLGLGVDMTLGSGWCFGGPWISREHANMVVVPKETPAGWEAGVRPSMRVKRAAPGGEGFMLNPLLRGAIDAHLGRFSAAFDDYRGAMPRAVYHDSFEYQANWSPNLLAEFEKRRGYRLQDHYDALFGKAEDDRARRVKGDYRATLSDLLVDEFTVPWTDWARERRVLTRNQAHGSPGNLLDLYALADVPETEMFRHDRSTLISKLASSAAHIQGRRMVASETGTWMKEHFQETLADMKELIQQLFVSGVNHVVYHGSIYSPDDAPWPGWLFYASTQMNARNPVWRDVPALNAWISRSQAMLQQGASDNDLLLYWPVHDVWHEPKGLNINFSVHSRAWLTDQPFGRFAQTLQDRGWTFDFVSDRLLGVVETVPGGGLKTPGAQYRAILAPPLQYMPPETLERLLKLVSAGATVVFAEAMPGDVPGFGDLEARRARMQKALRSIRWMGRASGDVRTGSIGRGRVLMGPVEAALAAAGVERETLTDRKGLEFIRRVDGHVHSYFLANRSAERIEGWVPLARKARAVVLMDPMTGAAGVAATRAASGGTAVYLQLEPQASVFLRVLPERPAAGAAAWQYRHAGERTVALGGEWRVEFVEGGPELPARAAIPRPDSWTRFAGPAGERFGGTARYSTSFDAPEGDWYLDLGAVHESARVRLNGRDLGTLIEAPFLVHAGALKPRGNELEIEATGLAANRIRYLDQQKVVWRNFHDINFVNSDYKPFDASNWPLRDSGLVGPVVLREAVAVTPK
ncbi:MAG: hypothetical protein M9913_23725 [Bryobacteraceae bacterium]|nr:glycoside hydrolase [Solibacteraceae bacterium]MCO5353846.1 hypothetical protein [Bryobacteraceae bacterium]